MQAVILAAGEGHRLRPLTLSRPKVMIHIANKPIIDYVIKSVTECGITDIIVVVGYRREQVIRYLNSLDLGIKVCVQEKQTGSADALKCAAGLITDDFILLPGDNYIDSESIRRLMREKNALLTANHPYPTNYGVVELSDGYVKTIHEKPKSSENQLVSTGIFSLTKDFVKYLSFCSIPDIISRMASEGIRIKTVSASAWHDSIYSWDLLKMNKIALKSTEKAMGGEISSSSSISGNVKIGRGTIVSPYCTIQGDVVIGEDCYIAPNVCIMSGTSIGSRVRIEPFTYIGYSVIMDDVEVGSHSRITDSVIGSGSKLSDHVSTVARYDLVNYKENYFKAHFAAVLGENVKVAPFAVLKHCVIGNGATIDNFRTVEGNLPDNSIVK